MLYKNVTRGHLLGTAGHTEHGLEAGCSVEGARAQVG